MKVQAGEQEQSLLQRDPAVPFWAAPLPATAATPAFNCTLISVGCSLKKSAVNSSQSPWSNNRKGANRINPSLRIFFLTKTPPRRFPWAAGWWLVQTADGAVNVELHPEPSKISLCAAEGMAEDKTIIYMRDQARGMSYTHFLCLNKGFMVPM